MKTQVIIRNNSKMKDLFYKDIYFYIINNITAYVYLRFREMSKGLAVKQLCKLIKTKYLYIST